MFATWQTYFDSGITGVRYGWRSLLGNHLIQATPYFHTCSVDFEKDRVERAEISITDPAAG
jgi:hypothetical protein